MSPRRNLRRFEKLERKRQERASEPTGPVPGRARFESLQLQIEAAGPSAATTERTSGAALGRFEAPETRPLTLQEKREEDQPFARCASCEADNSRYVNVCARCGARLDTPEQRAFNNALWAQRREALLAEQAQLKEVEAARQQEIEESAKANRAYYEALARRVGEETRARLDDSDVYAVKLPSWVRRFLALCRAKFK